MSKIIEPTNVEKMTIELHKTFRRFNEVFFKDSLPVPAITIESKGNRNAYGWCSVDAIWKGKDVAYHEIGLASEHVTRPFEEVATTLLHEMIHLHCGLNGIKDTSRGYTYHNKRFKAECESHGMAFEMEAADPKNGWFKPVLTTATRSILKEFQIDESAFYISRIDFKAMPKEKKKTTWKWACPCGTIVRSTKPTINIACLDCGGKFENVDPE